MEPDATRATAGRLSHFLVALHKHGGLEGVTASVTADGRTVTIDQSSVPADGWGTVQRLLNLPEHFPVRKAAARSKGGSKAHACGDRFRCGRGSESACGDRFSCGSGCESACVCLSCCGVFRGPAPAVA